MKKVWNVSKALMTATGVAVLGSVIACGAALMAMHEGFKTAGNIVRQAAEGETGQDETGDAGNEQRETAVVHAIGEKQGQVEAVVCEVSDEQR